MIKIKADRAEQSSPLFSLDYGCRKINRQEDAAVLIFKDRKDSGKFSGFY